MKKHAYLLCRWAVLGLVMFSPSLFAAPDFLQPFVDIRQPLWTVDMAEQDRRLYDCGLEKERERICSDDFVFAHTTVRAEWFVSGDRLRRAVLQAVYSPANYADLQLSLRHSGYGIESACVETRCFDVRQAVQRQGRAAADRALVTFINQPGSARSMTQQWVTLSQWDRPTPVLRAELTSDGQQIQLSLIRADVPEDDD